MAVEGVALPLCELSCRDIVTAILAGRRKAIRRVSLTFDREIGKGWTILHRSGPLLDGQENVAMVTVAELARLFEIGRHPLRLTGRSERDGGGHVVETLTFATEAGEPARGFLTRPRATNQPLPAILYIHAHGNRYDIGASELLDGRAALQSPLGPVFAEAGYVTLCIDLPCFGERAGITESAAAKAHLWEGRSLAGQMLGELASALDYLAARPDVNAGRIGVFGISMGATFGYWLAAVEPRLACAVHLCCFADFRELIAGGAHDRHGIYLTIPGLLGTASNGEIAGLIAPRPQLICIGDKDTLTPPRAVDIAFAETLAAYEAAGERERLVLHRESATGHEESAAMRKCALDFLAAHLGGAAGPIRVGDAGIGGRGD
jgi:pimeloyl-ACP methyl ester carboxylesterase